MEKKKKKMYKKKARLYYYDQRMFLNTICKIETLVSKSGKVVKRNNGYPVVCEKHE